MNDAKFAKKASGGSSLGYNIILKLRRDFPNLTIRQEEKKVGKKCIPFAQMEGFIALHRNTDEPPKLFNNVRKLPAGSPCTASTSGPGLRTPMSIFCGAVPLFPFNCL